MHCVNTRAHTSFSPSPFPVVPTQAEVTIFPTHVRWLHSPGASLHTVFINRDLLALLRCLKTCPGSRRLPGEWREARHYHPAPSSFPEASCPPHAGCRHTSGHLRHLGGSLFTTQLTAFWNLPAWSSAPHLNSFRSLSCHSYLIPPPDRELLRDRDLSHPS